VITDDNNCTAVEVVVLEAPPQSFIDAADVTHTSCDEENGILTVNVTPANGVEYSLNGSDYQVNNTFPDLAPGTYIISTLDSNNCPDEIEETILPSVSPQIDIVQTSIDTCFMGVGQISIEGSGGNGNLQYSLDGISFSTNPDFTNLSEGSYTAYVQDEDECIVETRVSIDGSPVIGVGLVDVDTPGCFDDTGVITLNPFGGTGDIQFSINGSPIQDNNIFENLASGDYEISFVDELGCEVTQIVSVPIPLCPIYVPNVISPDNDTQDDIFQIFTNDRYEVGIIDYRIYDRWGELVYVSGGHSIHTTEKVWWDGTFNDGPAEMDVYTYMIEVMHPNGFEEVLAGSVTLLR